jgi:hypothetical protein
MPRLVSTNKAAGLARLASAKRGTPEGDVAAGKLRRLLEIDRTLVNLTDVIAYLEEEVGNEYIEINGQRVTVNQVKIEFDDEPACDDIENYLSHLSQMSVSEFRRRGGDVTGKWTAGDLADAMHKMMEDMTIRMAGVHYEVMIEEDKAMTGK